MLRHSLSRQPVAALNARRIESKMSFDTERFIIEIENRPCLWNNALKEYSDRNLKIKCWDEMVNIFKEKEDMTNEEKNQLSKMQDMITKIKTVTGGSLIHSSVVLSATSCFHNRLASEIVAFVGGRDLTNDSIKANASPVSEIVRHEDYYEGDRSNNIALLFLREQVTLGQTIGTICLPENNAVEPKYLQCFATGYGPDQDYRYPRTMQVLEMRSTTRYTCEREVQMSTGNRRWKLDKDALCMQANMDNCAPDGGSALICQVRGNKAVYIQYGILTLGSKCGERPALYTKTSSMRKWIDKKMTQQKYTMGNYTYKSYK